MHIKQRTMRYKFSSNAGVSFAEKHEATGPKRTLLRGVVRGIEAQRTVAMRGYGDGDGATGGGGDVVVRPQVPHARRRRVRQPHLHHASPPAA